jgi:hypothetical protein
MAKKSWNQQVPVEKTPEPWPPITNGPATTAHSATAQAGGWRTRDRTQERTRHNEGIFLTRPEIRPTRGSNLRPRGATREPQPSGLRTFCRKRGQNRDVVEWWGEWSILRWPFYSSRGCESDGLRRLADNDGADSMLQFWLERKDDETKHWQKMKQRQRACVCLHGNEAWHGAVACQRRPEERWHRGGEREEMMSVRLTRILLDQEMKKNAYGRFSCYK